MAYATTYDALIAEAQTIVESTNEEFVAELPNIIARAQDQVQLDLNLAIWRQVATPAYTSGVSTITRDPAWLKIHSVFIGRFLEERHADYLQLYGGANGTPKYWCQEDVTAIELAPTPDTSGSATVKVTVQLPALADDNQTNWITDNTPELLLLQTLIGSEMYLQGQERVAEFSNAYQIALAKRLDQLKGTQLKPYTPIKPAARVG